MIGGGAGANHDYSLLPLILSSKNTRKIQRWRAITAGWQKSGLLARGVSLGGACARGGSGRFRSTRGCWIALDNRYYAAQIGDQGLVTGAERRR